MILGAGGGGLSVAFDMPTLMGRDSDDPRCLGEVGHCGVAIDSAIDMEVLFDGIDLGTVTTSMTISGPAVPIFCMYVVAAERQGVPIDRLEAQGLVERRRNPRDGRGVLARLTPAGKDAVTVATRDLMDDGFGLAAYEDRQLEDLFELLRVIRVDAGDFQDDGA
jgi:hypothetical protein